MTALYPIGTQLITRRLSQAALYHEIFCWKNIESFSAYENRWGTKFVTHVGNDYISAWRVTVTAENQKWLSPVPMVGDKIQYHQDPNGSVYVSNIVSFINDEILDLKADPSTDAETYETEISIYQVHDILKRTYPNGQRAPLIEFHEVLLPEGAIA
jgi:hypothetical protein